MVLHREDYEPIDYLDSVHASTTDLSEQKPTIRAFVGWRDPDSNRDTTKLSNPRKALETSRI